MDIKVVIGILLSFLGSALSDCGFNNCPPIKPDMINVHLVPHTHDDVGWLKNVDEYYYGSNKDITPVGVQYILDSVIPELIKDPSKRFIYVEMAFFHRWWMQQHDIMRHQVRRLVQNGQLEFILGGWCMNDEASAHYNAIIDQMTWGLKFINDTFGECARPKVAWQIDPFGHAKEQANLFAQMGFDGLFFGRLDYADKDKRCEEKTMEMMWKGSATLGKSSWLFTGALYNGYGPPDGYCFDVFCDDEPIKDDPRLHGYNVESRVSGFVSAVMDQAQHYTTNNIIMTMGSDFNYVYANSWYKNLDKLIKHTNALQANGSKVNLIYSTPSCYLKAVHDNDKTYTVKTDDFFPYASDPHAFWTGYFTSRPALKGMVRRGNNFLQVCKQLGALTSRDWTPGPEGDVTVMREAMGVLQHHDAVTGTAKQAVTFDYAERLANGFSECEKVVDYAFRYLAARNTSDLEHKQYFCPLLNVTQCNVSEQEDAFVVNVYNPLARKVSKYIRLPVQSLGYVVNDPQGKPVPTQISLILDYVKLIPGRNSSAKYELVFQATDIPPLGFKAYHVNKVKNMETAYDALSKSISLSFFRNVQSWRIGNDHVSLIVDGHGEVNKVIQNGNTMTFQQEFGYYSGHPGNNSAFKERASGAYIFRPIKQEPNILMERDRPVIFKGPLFEEIYQKFSPYVSQVARIYKDSEDIEFNWVVGPIPVSDHIGKEIITRFRTDIKSGGTFYTDSNGRQMMQRQRNSRPTWKLNLTEPVSSNYYPVNSRIFVRDEKSGQQMTILTDRSQGGTSMKDGELELMIHRRLLYDDAFGVGEALNEMAFGQGLVVSGKHWLQMSPGGSEDAEKRHRFRAQQEFMDVVISFTPTGLSPEAFRKKYVMEYSSLSDVQLPLNVHLLTMEEWHGNSRDAVLLRFENFFDSHGDEEFSQPATFKLQGMFRNFKISKVEEVILSANLHVEKLQRLEWNVEEDNELPLGSPKPKPLSEEDGYTVTLKPMQIRTFICNFDILIK